MSDVNVLPLRIFHLLSIIKTKLTKFECSEEVFKRNFELINFLQTLTPKETVTPPTESLRPAAFAILKNLEFNQYDRQMCDTVIKIIKENSDSLHQAYELLKENIKHQDKIIDELKVKVEINFVSLQETNEFDEFAQQMDVDEADPTSLPSPMHNTVDESLEFSEPTPMDDDTTELNQIESDDDSDIDDETEEITDYSSSEDSQESDLSSDTDDVVSEDEDENTMQEENSFVISRFNHKTQRTEMKPQRGKVWYAQLKPNEKVIWTRCNKPTQFQCSICNAKLLTRNKKWHEIAHNGGEKCTGCNYVFFNQMVKLYHQCKKITPSYQLKAITVNTMKNNNKIKQRRYVAKIVNAYPEYHLFAIPLTHKITKDELWWIGTGTQSANKNAKSVLKGLKKYKRTNFVNSLKNIKQTSLGCRSLIDLLYNKNKNERYRPHPDRALQLPLLGGNNNIMQTLKCWIRFILNTPAHHKSDLGSLVFKKHRADILEKLQSIPDMPLPQRKSLEKYVEEREIIKKKKNQRKIIEL